jgi:hypothetical protein
MKVTPGKLVTPGTASDVVGVAEDELETMTAVLELAGGAVVPAELTADAGLVTAGTLVAASLLAAADEGAITDVLFWNRPDEVGIVRDVPVGGEEVLFSRLHHHEMSPPSSPEALTYQTTER